MVKKRFWLLVLILLGVALIFNHVRWVKQDDRLIFEVDGRKVDLMGIIKNQLTQITRDCRAVSRLEPDHPKHLNALGVIRDYSPPQSGSGQLISAWSSADWLLVEAEFTELLPAVVLLHNRQGQWQVVPHATWSGSVQPWKAAPLIRTYMTRQAPDVPSALLDCFEPQSKYFKT
jgi:hypothetical protein